MYIVIHVDGQMTSVYGPDYVYGWVLAPRGHGMLLYTKGHVVQGRSAAPNYHTRVTECDLSW